MTSKLYEKDNLQKQRKRSKVEPKISPVRDPNEDSPIDIIETCFHVLKISPRSLCEMKMLYLISKETGDTVRKFIEENRKSNDVTVVKINENKDYGQIVDLIDSSDKVIAI